MSPFVFLALAAVTLKDPTYPLRSGCSAHDSVVAELRQGDEIKIKFSITGEGGGCFKVSTAKGNGYLPAAALSSTEEFEKARQAGATLEITKVISAGCEGGPLAQSAGLRGPHVGR